MRSVPVIYSFARSGGTLLNQILGSHPRCFVLSEVNPAATYKPIVEQAMEWFGLVASHEADEFFNLSYQQKIMTLHDRAMAKGKHLIVRDWATINFLPRCSGELITPSGQLEQKLYLEYAGIETIPLVIARRGAKVYESIKQNFLHLQNMKMDEFSNSYLAYAKAVTSFPIVHLETLRAQPDITLREILRRFYLDDIEPILLLRTFHEFKNCTGNNTLQTTIKSAIARQILPPEMQHSNDFDISKSPRALIEADRLLGYD